MTWIDQLRSSSHTGDEAAARNNVGLILLRRGQIAESLEQFRLAARMRPYYRDAAANYRLARDLNFQRQREAKTVLRSDWRGELRPKSLASLGSPIRAWVFWAKARICWPRNLLRRVQKNRLSLLTLRLVGRPEPTKEKFGELLGSGFPLGRVLAVPDQLTVLEMLKRWWN